MGTGTVPLIGLLCFVVGLCSGLQPQISSVAIWDEIPSLKQAFVDKSPNDTEFVQLDQTASLNSQAALSMQAQMEAKLTQKSLGLKTINELNHEFVKHLVKVNSQNQNHKRQMRKHKMQARKRNEKINLAQVRSSTQSNADLQLLQKSQVKSRASIKAPKDPKKLKLVQLNNEKPIRRPRNNSLLQINSEINLQGLSNNTQKLTLNQALQLHYDDSDLNLEIQMHIDEYQNDRLVSLKKERRQLREKILCGENCQLQMWSFMTGITLNDSCPIDCRENELNGQFKFKTSVAALEAYNSQFNIRDLAKNKEELSKLDFKIAENQNGFGN